MQKIRKHKKKNTRIKVFAWILAIVIGLSTLGFFAFRRHKPYTIEYEPVQNVILFIGDGMGENHIENALTYFNLDDPAFFSDRQGSLATYSANSPITDSAAAATALATGQKANNREIARHNGKDLPSISELAKAAGKKVGIVTTDTLTGATPASFSSHANDRGDRNEIALGQAASNIDLFIGQAETDFGYYKDFHGEFEKNGYTFVKSPEEMQAAKNTEKLVACLPEVRSEYNAGNETDYQIADMVRFAVEFLDNENGYFLMIESAYIDKFSHDHELIPALCEARSMIDAIDYLYEEVTVDGDTALLITADHETGWLAKAPQKNAVTSKLYTGNGHSFAYVPFFMKNVTLRCPGIFPPQNTIVFEICKQLLNV